MFVHDGPFVGKGEPREVQSFAQVRAGGLGLALGPKSFHHLKAVGPVIGGER